jgi:hypothetical protein
VPVPAVEVADEAHGARIGRPHREPCAIGVVLLREMCAELLVQPDVSALAEEVDVLAGEDRGACIVHRSVGLFAGEGVRWAR